MILCADIGGTNTRLRLIQVTAQGTSQLLEKVYPSQQYPDFPVLLNDFLSSTDTGLPEIACLAVAGPVRAQTCKITNLPWFLNAQDLQQTTGIHRVHLINDFEAVGYAVEALKPDQLHCINTGNPEASGRKAVLGPGTGLGIAFLVSHRDRYCVYPTEGGHADFAPRTDEQSELLAYWQTKQPGVSVEHFLSGPGLVRIHSWLCNSGLYSRNPNLEADMQHNDAAAAITHYALQKEDSAAAHALEIFLNILAAQAGNVALQYMSTGGLYIAGGILPRLLSSLDKERFMNTFCNKSGMENLLRQIPVHIITHPQPGLEGALYYAQYFLGE